jgi:hypothetical protein
MTYDMDSNVMWIYECLKFMFNYYLHNWLTNEGHMIIHFSVHLLHNFMFLVSENVNQS